MIAFLYVLCCLWLWYPIKVYTPVLKTERVDPRPAGEITSRFDIDEVVKGKSGSILPVKGVLCVGLRFATFRRGNAGEFEVGLQQGNETRGWSVDSDALDDNEFRYFCPGPSFNLMAPFALSVKGRDGTPGKSPTVWLTSDSSLGRANIGGHENTRGLELVVARERRRNPLELIVRDHGAFLVGSLCTLFMGLLSLLWMRRPTV